MTVSEGKAVYNFTKSATRKRLGPRRLSLHLSLRRLGRLENFWEDMTDSEYVGLTPAEDAFQWMLLPRLEFAVHSSSSPVPLGPCPRVMNAQEFALENRKLHKSGRGGVHAGREVCLHTFQINQLRLNAAGESLALLGVSWICRTVCLASLVLGLSLLLVVAIAVLAADPRPLLVPWAELGIAPQSSRRVRGSSPCENFIACCY